MKFFNLLFLVVVLIGVAFNGYLVGWNNGHDMGFVHGATAQYMELVDAKECMKLWHVEKNSKECDWNFFTE